jgi:hypothetical protein
VCWADVNLLKPFPDRPSRVRSAKKVLDSFPSNILCTSLANYNSGKWITTACNEVLKRHEWDEQGDQCLENLFLLLRPISGRGILDFGSVDKLTKLLDLFPKGLQLLSQCTTMWSGASLEDNWDKLEKGLLMLSQIPLQAEFVVSENIVMDMMGLVKEVNKVPPQRSDEEGHN